MAKIGKKRIIPALTPADIERERDRLRQEHPTGWQPWRNAAWDDPRSGRVKQEKVKHLPRQVWTE